MVRRQALGLIGIAGSIASAQCTPQWSAYPGPQLDNGVYGVTVWDPDGPGPIGSVVVAGGNFLHAGSSPLTFVGMWNGAAWLPMGDGVSGTVECVTTHDPDGAGPLLAQPVVGGDFSQTALGGTVLNGIALFDGSHWLPLDSGVGPHSPTEWSAVISAASLGPSLFIGGYFNTAGGVPVQGIARWDGAAWSALPDQRAWQPDTLKVIAGTLYAGGYFAPPGSPGILQWTGSTWSTIGANYPQDDVFAIAVYQGQLYAGGDFSNCCGGPVEPGWYIARYDGAAWQPVGTYGVDGPVRAFRVFDPDGPGPLPELLIVGGSFGEASGVPAQNIAAWDGTHWSALSLGTSGRVRAMTTWNNQLVVAGEFYSAGGLTSPGMAFWGCPQPTPCYPNCDQSTTPPILNVNDFTCFLNAFAADSPYANCDNSTLAPALNILDFVCFLNRFAAGCS